VFANTTEGIVVTDEKGTIQSVNEAFVQITGYSKSEAVGKTPQILKSGLQDAGFYAWMWKTLQETGMWKGNFWNRRKNGDLYPQETTINAIRNEHGEIVLYCGIFRDVTEQYKLEETLRMLSTTDGLTGLANRRTFDETIATEWRRSQRVGYSIATIMADIDNFKSYNDTYGHLEGDDCLKKVAQVFQAAVRRAGDLAARYGGEEFVLLLPMTKTNEAAHIAEEIRRKVEALGILHEHSDASPVVTISMGVAAVVPTQDMSVEDLIALADQALYQAKREGKNCARRVND
jgi:diguanylate cyclase (GGDEF)-like protein/PAS domain S-box-containing protein